MYTADILSRVPVAGSDDNSLQEEVEAFVDGVVERSLPATEQHIQMCTGTWCVSRLLNIAKHERIGEV